MSSESNDRLVPRSEGDVVFGDTRASNGIGMPASLDAEESEYGRYAFERRALNSVSTNLGDSATGEQERRLKGRAHLLITKTYLFPRIHRAASRTWLSVQTRGRRD